MDFKEIHSYSDLTNERETDFMEVFSTLYKYQSEIDRPTF